MCFINGASNCTPSLGLQIAVAAFLNDTSCLSRFAGSTTKREFSCYHWQGTPPAPILALDEFSLTARNDKVMQCAQAREDTVQDSLKGGEWRQLDVYKDLMLSTMQLRFEFETGPGHGMPNFP
jgi:hypothetical protein